MTPEELREKVADAMSVQGQIIFDDDSLQVLAAIRVVLEAAVNVAETLGVYPEMNAEGDVYKHKLEIATALRNMIPE